ncbi:hypothetical protein BH24ACT25_BH24ACT25_08950 [soil metagenome]
MKDTFAALPRTTFPGAGPDQTLFFALFAIGFAVAVLGYLVGSKTLRLIGILVVFFATALLFSDVFSGRSL